MALTVNTKTYTADKVEANAVVYNGPAHTFSIKDDIQLRRSSAKPSSGYSGTARVAAKLTRTHTLTGALSPTGDSIADLQFNLPVGIADADVDAIVNDLGAFVASAAFKTIVKKLQINN